METAKKGREETKVKTLCELMGPSQKVTICEEPGRDGAAEVLFSGKAAALRRQFPDLMEREPKHVTTFEDDTAILRGSTLGWEERQRRGIVIYVYSK